LQTLINEDDGYWNLQKVINTFHLDTLLDEQVIKLSNGETKRVMIASALVTNPKIITFDHPLTGLDTNARDEFSSILTSIIESGITPLMATSPFEIPNSVTHVAVVKNNNVIFKCERSAFNPSHFDFLHPIEIESNELLNLISFDDQPAFSSIVFMKDVTVEYDGKKILDHINWHVQQGERWALTGPNGAGKSTLLSLINADNPQAYANDIILFDRKRGSGESIWDIKRLTGFVSPELYQYFPTDSSCLHVIESGFYDTIGLFRPTDISKENICRRWMKMMQIDQYANRLFSMVPASVQRLCLLARAIVKNPTLLILDEPTQGLDISQQQFFTHLIDQICNNSRVTLIYVSHYEEHIPRAVTRRIRLAKGKTV
jgi:molybdate transport system ATP-binding protein